MDINNFKKTDKLKLWKFCGFEPNRLQYLDGDYQYNIDAHLWRALPIDLDTLYEFAIPKLQKEGYSVKLIACDSRKEFTAELMTGGFRMSFISADTPAEALFNAIVKVIDNEVK
jgi:hypothetical protein